MGALLLCRALLAGVSASFVVLGAACLSTPPVPQAPTPEVPFTTEHQSPRTAVDAGLHGQPERVRIVGAGAERVNLRAEPGTIGARLKGLADGTELELVGLDSTVEGRSWRKVRDPSDQTEGWVVAEFLAQP